MTLHRRDLLKLVGSSAGVLAAREALAAGPALHRDVCILGGGSAGTYAALRLRDQGRTVAIVERSSRLGGHAETYRDPGTGAPIDIGVIVFPDNPLVRGYFGRFGVPLITPPAGGGGGRSSFVDFRTGRAVSAYEPSQAELGAALVKYFQLVTGPFGFLAQNGYQLPDSGPLLRQLVQPFGEFAKDNGLEALLPLFHLYEQGFGPLLDIPTLYVLKNLGPEVTGAILGGSFLSAATGVGSLYDAATTALASDTLFDSEVLRVVRPPRGPIVLVVDTPRGPRVVQCEKLLVTAPPLLSNLCQFDLDATEWSLFSRFDSNHYYTGVLETSGLAPDQSLVNAAPDTPFNLPRLPGIYSISPSPVPGLTNVKYGSTRPLSDHAVRAAIRADLGRVKLPGSSKIRLKDFAIFKAHSPYALMASPSEIRRGFYASLEGLQGRRRTYYASATFQTHSSAAVWAYVEGLLPSLVA